MDGKALLKPALFAALFVCGAAAGTLVCRTSVSAPLSDGVVITENGAYGAANIWSLLFSTAKYHLLMLACGTSFLGLALVPAIFALQGFTLSCTAASLVMSYPSTGAVLTIIVLGLPSLLTVPSLFILGRDSMAMSMRLAALLRRRSATPAGVDMGPALIISAVSLIIAVGIKYSIVPIFVKFLL